MALNKNSQRLPNRPVVTADGRTIATPLFLPVFQPGNPFVTIKMLARDFGARGLITNAFFLYKNRASKALVAAQGIREFLGFSGLIMTDSGAFQQFSGPLYLSNKTIISFQQDIGVDVASPLDVITTPGDNRTNAAKKLDATLKRIKEGLSIADRVVLAGVQQGGKFLDLRGRALEALVEFGVTYIALGSLVPFFTKGHHVEFIGKVLQQARAIVPDHIPLHLYGAGDPLEIPFYVALGCDIFDSSSFIHYARGGWYMTTYGALPVNARAPGDLPYVCECPYCAEFGSQLWQDEVRLSHHNLWTILHVLDDVTRRRSAGTLTAYLDHVLDVHQQWFPDSLLRRSWEALQ
jgi:7-cyano-7-deazaguanine tRNA-ribosyltransferase